jgi:Anti-sigma-K factor rskA
VSDRPPSFDELAGDDLPAAERDRLQRVHDLLVAAGPPPELPPSLVHAPDEPPVRVTPLSRRYRYRYTVIAAAAAAVITLFGTGYAIGHRGTREAELTVPMVGPHGARAVLSVYAEDRAGNWPMTLEISGLEQLPAGKTYALWLTRHGKLVDPCGTFAVTSGTTKVPLNAPYKLKDYDGWVIVRTGATKPLLSTA